MAGQRRAQYVSIPLGPGVLSNPTGRGARTRINYMNWDRWFDSSWVRWHKLLPEKQGGWQYQAFTLANAAIEPIPGSPLLLLHFNGANGDAATVDSSVYANAVSFGSLGGTLSTTDPKFGPTALSVTDDNPDSEYCVAVPFAHDAPLDIFSTVAWTIEFWFRIPPGQPNGGVYLVDYGGSQTGGVTSSIFIDASEVAGALSVAANDYSAFGTGGSVTAAQNPSAPGLWHHVALVANAGVVHLYLDGFDAGSTPAWNPSVYTGPSGIMNVIVGSFGRVTSAPGNTCEIDELRVSGFAVYTSNFTPPVAENTLGVPNTLGTPNPPNGFIQPVYSGVARDIHDWASIDGQYWVALGTHQKLYVDNQATLYDITPQRKTSNLMNPLTTTNGSDVVTVIDNDHRAATGDFIFITGAGPVGGLLLEGNYEVAVIDPNTYTVFAGAAATSGATGGGSFSIAYDIGAGLGANGQLLGYGTGLYGLGTYGTPRAFGTGVFARMRTWSLDNYGQDLVASQSDGEIYYWARNGGPNSRAQLLVNAPTGCQRVLADAQQQVLIALGCSDESGQFDAQIVRWCSFGDVNDWFETDINTAGSEILPSGSRIITGLKTKGQNLIFTDKTVYRMVFVGEPDIYDFIPAGDVTIVGPNACVDVDGVAYLMGFDNFYNYSGTLNLQGCDVWETVFDPNFQTSLNKAQSESVVCYTYEPKTEVTWLYQSLGGAFTVAFTAGLAMGAVQGTLSAPWSGSTDFYSLEFADQETQPVLLTNGSTAATWNQPLLAAVAGTATNVGNDRYVTFNWEDGVWYYGLWNRTCANGRAPAMGGNPYGVNGGYLYAHEVGTDAIEAAGTFAIGFYMRSLDITVGGAKSEYTMGGSDARFAVGGSDAHLLVRSLLPDWKTMTGSMNVTIFTKDRPQDPTYVQSGPIEFTVSTDQIDIDAHGSQIVLQFDNFTAGGGLPSLGSAFRMGILQGLATPYAKR